MSLVRLPIRRGVEFVAAYGGHLPGHLGPMWAPDKRRVVEKDRAAVRWCENASALTGKTWKYEKVPQKEFEQLRPTCLSDLSAIQHPDLFQDL